MYVEFGQFHMFSYISDNRHYEGEKVESTGDSSICVLARKNHSHEIDIPKFLADHNNSQRILSLSGNFQVEWPNGSYEVLAREVLVPFNLSETTL
jgi:hypothetical protein